MLFRAYTDPEKVLSKQNGLIFMQKRILFKSEVRAGKTTRAQRGALAPVSAVK